MQRLILAVFAVFLLIASPSNADVLITNRTSLLVTSVDFGFVGSVNKYLDSFVYTTIDGSQLVRQGSATDGGPVGDGSWDASYQFNLDQQLVLGTARGFSGSGSVGLFTFAGGEGVSHLLATNRLEVDFENTVPTAFELGFVATDTSRLELQQMTDPGNWVTVYSHPGMGGEIATTLPLVAGVFRLTSETVVNTDNGGSNGGSYSFSIAAVPEPSSMVLLMFGATVLLFRS